MTTELEYRVKPIMRYVVTRYEDTGNTGSVSERGTFDNADVAYEVAYAMCKLEHEKLGYKIDDERVQYPEHPNQVSVERFAPEVIASMGDKAARAARMAEFVAGSKAKSAGITPNSRLKNGPGRAGF